MADTCEAFGTRTRIWICVYVRRAMSMPAYSRPLPSSQMTRPGSETHHHGTAAARCRTGERVHNGSLRHRAGRDGGREAQPRARSVCGQPSRECTLMPPSRCLPGGTSRRRHASRLSGQSWEHVACARCILSLGRLARAWDHELLDNEANNTLSSRQPF